MSHLQESAVPTKWSLLHLHPLLIMSIPRKHFIFSFYVYYAIPSSKPFIILSIPDWQQIRFSISCICCSTKKKVCVDIEIQQRFQFYLQFSVNMKMITTPAKNIQHCEPVKSPPPHFHGSCTPLSPRVPTFQVHDHHGSFSQRHKMIRGNSVHFLDH